jgi:UDP-glucose 4-epimerase
VKTKPTVLVTGGAGYIGSHVTWALLDAGWGVVVIDDLSTGHRELVPDGATFAPGDIADGALVGSLLQRHACAAVLHFAGSIVVGESVDKPLAYYANNVCATVSLIDACVRAGVKRLVYSSTAAVYGEPTSVPVGEDAALAPINPYGHSKRMSETVLVDAAAAHGLSFAILRYFNVAGADPLGRTGQCSPNATHLIKLACQAALGRRDGVDILGEDYPTADGTGIRDYIHVGDLAEAHLAALDRLFADGDSVILNCGYGHGYSVRQVLETVRAVSGVDFAMRGAPRRPGDAAELVADAHRILADLDWTPRHDDLAFIVKTALDWERTLSHPDLP